MALTIRQVFDGLRGLGTEKVKTAEDGTNQAQCPVCRADNALRFGDGPFGGAFLQCENDTPEQIEGALKVGLSRLRKLTDDPLGYVKEALDDADLTHIIKHGRAGASYILHYADGTTVELGSVAILLSQAKFRAAYLPQRRRLPTKTLLTAPQWARLVECIERAAQERDTVATDTEEARGWLARYIRQTRAITLDTEDTEALYEHLTPDAGPFTDKAGRLHIRLSELATWINQIGGGRVTSRDLSARLSELGFERAQPSARRPPHVHDDPRHPPIRKQRYYASTPSFDLNA